MSLLSLQNVSFRDATRQSLTLRNVNWHIEQGEMVTLRIPPSSECRAFTSMLQGLRMPQEGQVLFEGNPWTGKNFARHDQMRSHIGRVFDGTAWIENMNIYENVVLPLRHHTNRALDDIDREVKQWARRFDIEEVSTQRPAFVGKTYLRVCEWVRAFIGSPSLLILEHPMRSVPSVQLPKLMRGIDVMLARQTACLWIGRESEFTEVDFPAETKHYRIVDHQFETAG